jgi:hypothetical protein
MNHQKMVSNIYEMNTETEIEATGAIDGQRNAFDPAAYHFNVQ